jgi:trimeric autotransporter adhesin
MIRNLGLFASGVLLVFASGLANAGANLQIAVPFAHRALLSLHGVGGDTVPTITSLSPAGAYVNSAGFTLTVNGTGFVSGAAVSFAYTTLTTTYVSATKLTAQVPASLLSGTGSYYVSVTDPGGSSSNSVEFDIDNLDPSLGNVSPSAVVAGTAPSAIVINGSNFMNGATVLWNGKPVATTYVNSQQLQATPTKGELGAPGIVQLSVSNPSPGGVSPAVEFNVTYPAKVTVLDLPANNLVWDPFAQRVYASVPSSYGSLGNSIAVINPSTGKVTGYYFAGSEPNALALSSDSKYLYTGLNGSGSVQRLVLPKFTQDIDVSLGTSIYGGSNIALSLQVSPGDSHTFAVAEGTSQCCGGLSGLYFYTDATQLPDSVTYPSITDIAFVSSTTLYGYSNGTVSDVTVNSSGGTLGQQFNGLVEGSVIQYAGGLIYGSNGQVLNPSSGLLVGTYDVGNSCCNSPTQLLPDSAIDRVFVAGNTPFFNLFGITSYDLAKFTPLGVVNLEQLNGSATPTLIRWGNNGLAFVLQPGCCGGSSPQVVLVQSPAMLLTTSGTKSPLPVAKSLSPASAAHGSWNFVLTVRGQNFVPGSQVTWNGHLLAADYVSASQLNVYVPAASIASSGTANIVVTNPAPGGGASSALPFSIN